MKASLVATLALGLALPAASAQSLLTNGDFEADPFDTGWDQLGSTVFGGLAPGSTKSAALGAVHRIGQNLTGVSPNWQLEFSFAIKNTTNRAFSLFVNNTGNAANGSAATINLRYQSGQFNTFAAGSFGSDLGLGTVDFSNDANSDGDFDDVGDVKNVYRMRITGTGWGGTPGTYDIQLSNANATTFTRSVTGLSRYQNSSGTASVPMAFLFNSINGTNPGFWVDDVSFTNIAVADDPNLTLTTPPPIFGTLPVDATAATTRTITIQNTGANNNLTLTAGTFTGPDAAKYSLAETFPITILPGASAPLNVTFTPGAARGAFNATLSLASDDPSSPLTPISLPVQLYATGDSFLTNGNFEATPATNSWIAGGTVTTVPSLTSTPGQAVQLSGPGTGGLASQLGQTVVGPTHWQLSFDLAIPPIVGRSLQVLVHNFGEPTRLTDPAINLRYENGVFAVLSNATWVDLPQLGSLVSSEDTNADGDFDDAGEVKNVHRLRITGRDWGTPMADYQIETTAANATAFTQSVSRLNYRPAGLGDAVNSPPASIIFVSNFGNTPGYTLDNVAMIAGAPPRPVVFEPLDIRAENGEAVLTWVPALNATYKIYGSTDLTDWTVLDGGLTGPEYRDTFNPALPRRFYRVERE